VGIPPIQFEDPKEEVDQMKASMFACVEESSKSTNHSEDDTSHSLADES
jgi:hypothetical protein